MKALFLIALAAAILWTAFVWFANAMKPAETGPFIGGGTIVVAWLIVAVLGAAAALG